jgi:hypothetical protein
MTRVRDAGITLICLVILVPLLVLSTAVAGLHPRHWSGIPLSTVELPFLHNRPHSAGTRPAAQDEVTNALVTMKDPGWFEDFGGQDGRIYIMTSALSPSLLPGLGHRFDGETVGVIDSPLAGRSGAAEQGGDSITETWWQRTDPLGTWVTLMFGFPWQLGTVLLLTAIVWAFVLRRRHKNRHQNRSQPLPS